MPLTLRSTISPNGLTALRTRRFTHILSAALDRFHLRHIARSTDRLLSYAEGNQLTAEQLTALKAEQVGEESLAALLLRLKCRSAMVRIAPGCWLRLTLTRSRSGRKQLPTPSRRAGSCSGHTQRHVDRW